MRTAERVCVTDLGGPQPVDDLQLLGQAVEAFAAGRELATRYAALAGYDSYSVPISDDSGSAAGASRQLPVTWASSLPYIGSSV